jgi:hypothetical protein
MRQFVSSSYSIAWVNIEAINHSAIFTTAIILTRQVATVQKFADHIPSSQTVREGAAKLHFFRGLMLAATMHER